MYSFIVFIVLFIIGYSITDSLLISIIIAALFSSSVEALLINKMGKKQVTEGMTSKRTKKKSRKSSKSSKSSKAEEEKDSIDKLLKNKKFPKGKYKFDPKKSYRHAYGSLSKNQSRGLKKDTKSLIKTQEKLMNTLKEMGPVLTQGKTIIGAFDNFFGDGSSNKNDLGYMAKRLGINPNKIK